MELVQKKKKHLWARAVVTSLEARRGLGICTRHAAFSQLTGMTESDNTSMFCRMFVCHKAVLAQANADSGDITWGSLAYLRQLPLKMSYKSHYSINTLSYNFLCFYVCGRLFQEDMKGFFVLLFSHLHTSSWVEHTRASVMTIVA